MTKRTDAELEALADRLAGDEDIDPAGVTVDRTDDLRAVARAADAVTEAQAQLVEAVAVARAHGRSWAWIGVALGDVSRQAAQQRFGHLVEPPRV